MEQLAPFVPEIAFTPIEGMTGIEVTKKLRRSAAYVELGPLPGRDRLPREAIRQNTPIVMLKRGAGVFFDDFPLPEIYRVAFDENWIADTSAALRRVLAEPERALEDQRSFLDWVLSDHVRFRSEVAKWVAEDITIA